MYTLDPSQDSQYQMHIRQEEPKSFWFWNENRPIPIINMLDEVESYCKDEIAIRAGYFRDLAENYEQELDSVFFEKGNWYLKLKLSDFDGQDALNFAELDDIFRVESEVGTSFLFVTLFITSDE